MSLSGEHQNFPHTETYPDQDPLVHELLATLEKLENLLPPEEFQGLLLRKLEASLDTHDNTRAVEAALHRHATQAATKEATTSEPPLPTEEVQPSPLRVMRLPRGFTEETEPTNVEQETTREEIDAIVATVTRRLFFGKTPHGLSLDPLPNAPAFELPVQTGYEAYPPALETRGVSLMGVLSYYRQLNDPRRQEERRLGQAQAIAFLPRLLSDNNSPNKEDVVLFTFHTNLHIAGRPIDIQTVGCALPAGEGEKLRQLIREDPGAAELFFQAITKGQARDLIDDRIQTDELALLDASFVRAVQQAFNSGDPRQRTEALLRSTLTKKDNGYKFRNNEQGGPMVELLPTPTTIGRIPREEATVTQRRDFSLNIGLN